MAGAQATSVTTRVAPRASPSQEEGVQVWENGQEEGASCSNHPETLIFLRMASETARRPRTHVDEIDKTLEDSNTDTRHLGEQLEESASDSDESRDGMSEVEVVASADEESCTQEPHGAFPFSPREIVVAGPEVWTMSSCWSYSR